MLIQLREPLQVTTPLGPGWAILVEANGCDQFWTVALDSRAIVTFPQAKILMARSYTHGRSLEREEMLEILRKATQAA